MLAKYYVTSMGVALARQAKTESTPPPNVKP